MTANGSARNTRISFGTMDRDGERILADGTARTRQPAIMKGKRRGYCQTTGKTQQVARKIDPHG